ncbi:MAG: HAMP domain-containing histidine kinase [Lachnospiraceae bacterium]|nr:HAMP domain-containing histidine kinase [Lachnospiraceae bacterium]
MLYAIIAVLLTALIIVIIIFNDQRRQVRDICRQLAFLKEENSNLMITTGVGSAAIQELAVSINEMIESWRDNSDQLLKNKEVLQNTIMSLSHDIRTPLTSMTGYFQLMNEADSEEERERYRKVIESRIASLKLILEELFTYAKLQDSDYALEMMPVGLSKLTLDTILGFYEDFKSAKLEPEIDIEEAISSVTNEEAVIRIVQNLVKNALVHSLSKVSVSLKRMSTAKGEYAEFKVSNDTASPEDIIIEKVFERFYKADADRSKGSTGLGLSIVKGLTEKLGGSVSAQISGDIFSVSVKIPVKEY